MRNSGLPVLLSLGLLVFLGYGLDSTHFIPSISKIWDRLRLLRLTLNSTCMDDLQSYVNSFLGDKSVFNLFLYTGKGLNELGDYQGCRHHKGKYILLTLDIPLPLVSIGLCVPLQCTTSDLNPVRDLLRDMVNEQGGIMGRNLTIEEVNLHDIVEENRYNSRTREGTIASLLLLLLALMVGLAVSIANRLSEANERPKGSLRQLLTCFDLFTNLRSLFYEKNKLDPNLDIFHGVRVLSMFWVMLGHSFAQLAILTPVYNLLDFMDQVNNKHSLVLFTGGVYAVDIFFCLSGFFAIIACVNAFRQPANRTLKNVLSIIVQRYLRLLPIYVMCYLIFVYITPVIYDGPIIYRMTLLQVGCSESWYMNFLNVNNFRDVTKMCMGWTWYLANDFQFFLLAPFIVLIYYYRKKLAYLIVGFLIFASLVCQIGIINYFHINPDFFGSGYIEYCNEFYNRPYCRIIPYFVGIIFAWMYLSHKDPHSPADLWNTLNRWIIEQPYLRYVMYTVGLAMLTLVIVFFPFFYMGKHTPRPEAEITAFLVLSHVAFGLGFMLLTYPGCIGKARMLRTLMSLEAFAVMARVTYCAYMLHLIFFYFYIATLEEGMHFSPYKLFVCAVDVFVVSYFLSIILTLLFESPIVKLTKYLLRGDSHPKAIGSLNPSENSSPSN